MAKQKYIINKQLITLTLKDRKDIKELQESFSKLYHSELILVIEQTLDKYFSESDEIHHQINKLEIDLGKLDINSVTDQFRTQFDQSLKSLEHSNYAAFSSTEKSAAKAELEPERTPIHILSYYLTSGRLPWWSPDMSKSYLEAQLDTLIQKPELAFIELLTQLYRNENSLNRFLNSFKEEQLVKSTYLVAGISTADVYTFIEEVKKQVQDSGARLINVPTHLQVVKALLFNIFSKIPNVQQPPRSFMQMKVLYRSSTLDLLGINQAQDADAQLDSTKHIKSLIKYYLSLNKEVEIWQHFFQHLANKVSKSSFLTVSAKSLKKLEELLEELQSKSENTVLLSGINGVNLNSTSESTQQVKNRMNELVKSKLIPLAEHTHQIDREIHKAKAYERKPDSKEGSDFNETDFISVSNAGLVLLWPFLSRFFENLELVKDKVFIDNLSRHKAACILQFICTQDETEIFEGQLPLAKVICGIPMEEAVNIAEINATDKAIIEGLLHSIINQVPHWKKISVKGFVNSYIERPASLRVRDNHWLLQVEKETYDVLLQKLPWGFHTVSLPWMENVLVVEW